MCWNELLTTDTSKAQAFYTGLFGWAAKTEDMGPMRYTVFSVGGKPAAGMMQIEQEMGPIPPNWVVYFATDDCDGAIARATRNGGKALTSAMDVPNVGRFATLQDPQGAAFAVLKFAPPAS
jgi:predicted enzyme related to lactoylglutathione lyase